MPIEIVGQVRGETKESLRKSLLYAHCTFTGYGRLFRELGMSRRDLQTLDPLAVLRRLPPLEGQPFHDLVNESIMAASQIVDMETSSGTTGPRKRRVITYNDDASETEFLAKLFGTCGIVGSDRVACLDTDPLTLMVSFTKALDYLGVHEAYGYALSPDVDDGVEGLTRLKPTVIIAISSILDRYLPALKRRFSKTAGSGLRTVVSVGERLSGHTRSVLEGELGVQVFAYYGASETSALGIECQNHDGIHLYTDRNIIEVATAEIGGTVGEILVTTLHQEGLPLLRYALKDLIEVKESVCPCGLTYPRVDVKGRIDGTASVLGANISYNAILDAAYLGAEHPGPMEVILTRNDQEKLKIVLPDRLAEVETKIKKSLVRREPDLAFLMASRFLALDLTFVDESYFESHRETRRIMDRRRDSNGASL